MTRTRIDHKSWICNPFWIFVLVFCFTNQSSGQSASEDASAKPSQQNPPVVESKAQGSVGKETPSTPPTPQAGTVDNEVKPPSENSNSLTTSAPALAPAPSPPPARLRRPNPKVKNPLPQDPYTMPLRFDVLNDGVKVSPLFLDWDLSAQDNLKISGVDYNDYSYQVGIYQASKLDPRLKPLLPADLGDEWLLVAKWPTNLIKTGTLEAISRAGQILWQESLRESDFDAWQEQQAKWKEQLLARKVSKDDIQKMPVMRMNLALRDFKMQIQPFWSLKEPFRICLTSDIQEGMFTRLCTRLTEVTHPGQKGAIALGPFPITPQPARIIAFNEQGQLKDSKPVSIKEPVQFYAELKSGASFEFVAKPAAFNMVEIVDLEGTDQFKLLAFGDHPNIPVTTIANPPKGLLEKLIGRPWYQTIGDFREYWEVNLPKVAPVLYIPGQGGGLFRETIAITKIPREKIRPYVKEDSIHDTYVNGAKIYGMAPPGVKVSSKQNLASIDDPKTNEFIWEFGAPAKGDYNKSYLLVNDGQNTFRAYREVYRGYPGEVSARVTGIYGTSGNFLFLGELATNYWFESILGSSNYYLSRHRWGIAAKYFQSANTLSLSPLNDVLYDTRVDLKYRLDPGLWSRDETWGVEVGLNQFNYSIFQSQFMGGGFFWARSMPRVFDELMNIVPVMRYPKWVDLEFIYYPVTSSTGLTLNNFGQGLGNWELNFHGKVMWTKQFFGEAGFGIKQYDMFQPVNIPGYLRLRFQFTSFYGTVGLGWSF